MDRRRFLLQIAAIGVGLSIPDAVPAVSGKPTDATSAPPALPVALGPAAKTIYLTFDDGSVGLAEKLAAVNALGVRATFFLTGQAITSHRADVQALVRDGHVLGNHTWDHHDLTRLSAAGVRWELNRCEAAARSIAGVSTAPRLRPPNGAANATVRNVAASLGYDIVLWDWDTRDWAAAPTAYMEQNFGAGIVLMHTQGPHTVAALADIVPVLAEQNYIFDVL